MRNEFGLDYDLGDGIDLTPLIDVVFLLLIFFIMATTFMKPIMDVNLASADSAESSQQQDQQLVIVIDREGTIKHDGMPISLEKLPLLFAGQRSQPINFMVDKETPFEFFVKAVDVARTVGRGDFVITTEPEK